MRYFDIWPCLRLGLPLKTDNMEKGHAYGALSSLYDDMDD